MEPGVEFAQIDAFLALCGTALRPDSTAPARLRLAEPGNGSNVPATRRRDELRMCARLRACEFPPRGRAQVEQLGQVVPTQVDHVVVVVAEEEGRRLVVAVDLVPHRDVGPHLDPGRLGDLRERVQTHAHTLDLPTQYCGRLAL